MKSIFYPAILAKRFPCAVNLTQKKKSLKSQRPGTFTTSKRHYGEYLYRLCFFFFLWTLTMGEPSTAKAMSSQGLEFSEKGCAPEPPGGG